MSLLQQTEPPIVSRLWSVLQNIRDSITPNINAAQIGDPIEVLVGYPTWTEGSKVWAQALDPGFVTVDALPDVKMVTRYRPHWGVVGPVVASFSAVTTTFTTTFSAVEGNTVIAGTSIQVIIMAPVGAYYNTEYTTLTTDTPDSVATAVAAAITALDIPGATASATGAEVTITGAGFKFVNIGGLGQAHKEVARVARTVQVSIWTNSPWSRYQIHDAITSTLGAVDNCWPTLPDGGRFLILGKGEKFNDQSQSSYNIYYAHLLYYVEYGVIQRATAYQIGAVSAQAIIQNEIQQTKTVLIG